MGMFTEIAAEYEAKKFKTLLDRAKASDQQIVIDFARKEIYPLYKDAVGEAWMQEDPEVQAFWETAGIV